MSKFQHEEAEILAAVKQYFDGVVNADPESITAAFDIDSGHLKSIATGDDGKESVKIESFSDARARWAAGQPNADSEGTVQSVEVIDGKLAIVKFDFRLGAARFLDVLSLYNLNDQWKVVNKMFVLR